MQTPQQPRFNNKKWCKPPSGYLKVNWDAACNVELGRLGFGAIIRDDNGAVLGTMRGSRNYSTTPLVPEALGLLLAAQFCKIARLR